MSGLVRPSISKKIALHFDLEPDLPPIEADRGQMQQVFMNLVLNAAEAIGSHDGLITVRTGVEKVDDRLCPAASRKRRIFAPGEYVCLEVRDTGCGMDEATKARIFDPFLLDQIHGARAGTGGRGRHRARPQGRDRGRQRAGQGQLLHGAVPGGGAGGRGTVGYGSRSAALKGAGVILVVDDEQVVREMAKKALERHGYTVLLADSGPAAIDVFASYPGEHRAGGPRSEHAAT